MHRIDPNKTSQNTIFPKKSISLIFFLSNLMKMEPIKAIVQMLSWAIAAIIETTAPAVQYWQILDKVIAPEEKSQTSNTRYQIRQKASVLIFEEMV